jgi:hypothetical protein
MRSGRTAEDHSPAELDQRRVLIGKTGVKLVFASPAYAGRVRGPDGRPRTVPGTSTMAEWDCCRVAFVQALKAA